MHCRPWYGTNIPICSSSFIFVRPGYFTNSNYQTYTPTSYHYHDQVPPLLSSPPPSSPPPPVTPRRRRRLEDPITTYASNYYATLPRQMHHLSSQQTPSQPPPPPPLPPPRRVYQQPDRNNVYCDLFNLLERPSPPSPPTLKQRRKYNPNDFSPRRHQRSIDIENAHVKVKNTDDRKRRHQQSCYYKEKKRQDDKLSSTEQYDRSPEETEKINNIYQRRSPNKGFFRRVVRNYFCMPSTFANNGYSS